MTPQDEIRPTKNDPMWQMSRGGAIWRSEDGGQTWVHEASRCPLTAHEYATETLLPRSSWAQSIHDLRAMG